MFKVKKVRPLFTGVVTTAERYSGDGAATTASGLVVDVRRMDGMLNTYQRVVAVGRMVSDVKEGDIVKLDLRRYLQVRHVPGQVEDKVQLDDVSAYYEVPSIELDGRECLLLQNNDIQYVVEEWEGADGGLLQ